MYFSSAADCSFYQTNQSKHCIYWGWLIHVWCCSEYLWQQEGVCAGSVCVHGNEGTCHPLQECDSLMCFNLFFSVQQCS